MIPLDPVIESSNKKTFLIFTIIVATDIYFYLIAAC